jgi:hypothetical protein
MWSAGQGDNQEWFLADLRALRDAAAIGYDELAARAHYPSSILKEAENGPGLPGLPILAAYVRACDADVPEWEERWRCLADVVTDPGLPVRTAGASPAAVAGARAGVSVAPPDAYDPERIRAALRGGIADRATRATRDAGQARTADAGRAAADLGHVDTVTPEGPATLNSRATGWGDGDTSSWSENAGPVSAWDTTPTWTTPFSPDTVPTNGNHHPTDSGHAFDTAVAEASGPDVTAVSQEDPVAAWLAGSEVAAPSEADRLWPEREDTEPAHWSVDGQLAPPVTAESAPGSVPSAGFTQDAGFAQDIGSVQDAGFARDTGYAQETGFTQPAGFAQDIGSAQDAGFTPSAGAAAQAATQPVRPLLAAVGRDDRRRDKFFPLRLAAVIVIAAIIGSILVLVIR